MIPLKEALALGLETQQSRHRVVRGEGAVSDDGKSFRTVAMSTHDVPKSEAGPLMRTITAGNLDLTARHVRVRAKKTGTVGRVWLFVDEILVNPKK